MGFLSSLFGSSKSKPATSTNIVQQKLAPEIAPFAKEVLTDAQALYKSQVERGYDPYTGQTIAPLTPEQEQAMAGISGLVGTARPLQEEALATYRQGGDQFTGEVAKQFMSPYQQAVTDIEKRKAQENFEGNVMPKFEADAVGAGGMSGLGTRAGIEAAELQRGQSQLLADIQARGSQSAYTDARKGFEAQQARERQMAGDVAGLGPAMFASGLQEQGALQSVGEEKQQLGQSVLDESYFKFLEEQQYPQQQLANYSGFVYGNPAAGLINQTGSGTNNPYKPSLGQNIMGIGSMLGSAAIRNPNMFAAPKAMAQTGGGIAGLVRRAEPGQVGSAGLRARTLAKQIRDRNEMDQDDRDLKVIGDDNIAVLETIKNLLAPPPITKQQERNVSNIGLGIPGLIAPADSQLQNISNKLGKLQTNKYLNFLETRGEKIKREKEEKELLLDAAERKGNLQSEAAEPNYDEEILQGRELVDPKIEAQLKKAEQADKDAGAKALTTKKVIQSLAGPSTPKALTNKQSAALTMKEAGKIFDEAPEKFGALTRKQYLADTKAQNEKYLAFVNKMYPEGQNEFLADALAALGSMFIAENKGEAFQKTFSELQAAGVKRRDARRIAIGKVGLENLKRDDATLEKIRMLPKQRQDAIMALIAARDKGRMTEATIGLREGQTKKALALAGKAKRGTVKKAGVAGKPDMKSVAPLLTTQSFYVEALKKYPIPTAAFAKTGTASTDPKARQQLIKETLANEAAQIRIATRAKQIERSVADQGKTPDASIALQQATSQVLKELFSTGQIGTNEGIIYGSNTIGLD